MKNLAALVFFILTACATPPAAASPVATSAAHPETPPAEADYFSANQVTLSQPACSGGLTPAQTEGPYYKVGSPEANILFTSGIAGKRMIVAGYVLDSSCHALAHVWLDFWQANASGQYDNQGYTLRGHQYSDSSGRYFLETIYPGEYPGRTEHIHVKIQAGQGPLVTTQIYFPNAPNNAADGIFDPRLLVRLENRAETYVAYFDFVVATQ